jgi:hypothetical protein
MPFLGCWRSCDLARPRGASAQREAGHLPTIVTDQPPPVTRVRGHDRQILIRTPEMERVGRVVPSGGFRARAMICAAYGGPNVLSKLAGIKTNRKQGSARSAVKPFFPGIDGLRDLLAVGRQLRRRRDWQGLRKYTAGRTRRTVSPAPGQGKAPTSASRIPS